jgi:hypothetical protein
MGKQGTDDDRRRRKRDADEKEHQCNYVCGAPSFRRRDLNREGAKMRSQVTQPKTEANDLPHERWARGMMRQLRLASNCSGLT